MSLDLRGLLSDDLIPFQLGCGQANSRMAENTKEKECFWGFGYWDKLYGVERLNDYERGENGVNRGRG